MLNETIRMSYISLKQLHFGLVPLPKYLPSPKHLPHSLPIPPQNIETVNPNKII
jgi:hypothetical protein